MSAYVKLGFTKLVFQLNHTKTTTLVSFLLLMNNLLAWISRDHVVVYSPTFSISASAMWLLWHHLRDTAGEIRKYHPSSEATVKREVDLEAG